MPHRRFVRIALAIGVMLAATATATVAPAPLGRANLAASAPECPAERPTATPATKPLTPIVDNRTTEERATAYTQGFQDHQTRRTAWIREFQRRGRDAATLPRSLRAASYAPPEPTLYDALRRADLVIEGEVTRVVHDPVVSIGTVRITSLQKVSPAAVALLGTTRPAEVTISMQYSVEPGPDYSQCGGTLVYGEPTPVLFPGARAIFLLRLTLSPVPGPPFYPQNSTGVCEIGANDTILTVDGNPFGNQARAYTPAGLLARVEDELRTM